MSKLGIKAVLDSEIKDISYDKNFHKKIKEVKTDFIMKNDNHRFFFSSGLIGCYPITYNYSDQDNFFDVLFGLNNDRAKDIFKKVTDINKSFKVSSDIINNYIFYATHRVLTSSKLSEKDRKEAALDLLDYFTYRTLAVIVSNYFIYPISESEAQSLYEKLSNKYLIKTVKNWIEFSRYRSEAFLESKFKKTLIDFKDSKDIANAINDLFIRSKDTIKNIYRDFIDMHEKKNYLVSKDSNVIDAEGQETIADRLHGPDIYYNYVISTLVDKNTFIKIELVELTTKIISDMSLSLANNTLNDFFDFYSKSKENHDLVLEHIHDILLVSIEYLFKNRYILSHSSDLVYIMNKIVGNLLYARGNDLEISNVKANGVKIMNLIYPNNNFSERYVYKLSNGLFVYICLRAFTKKHYN